MNHGPTTVGDDDEFLLTFKDKAGALEDITAQAITFLAYDDSGNSIQRTVGDGVVIEAQSGSTLGQATVSIVPGDYPAAWLALAAGERLDVKIEVEKVGATRSTPIHDTWTLRGQAIQ